jgi:hypothetical protein
MSYQDKLAQIRTLVDSYNTAIEEDDGRIDFDAFLKKLKKKGVIDEATLAYAKFELFEDCGLPRIQSEMAATISRASSAPNGTDKQYISAKKAERMNVRELVEAYDPKDTLGSAVTTRLKAITEGRKVVGFNTDQSVNVAATVALINEKIDGMKPRETYEVDGKPQPLFAIGERRGDFLDENPIFAGEALRPDGTCQHTDRSWQGVLLPLRQLIYIAFHVTHEAPQVDEENMHWVLDYIESTRERAESMLRKRWKKASVYLDEKIAEGQPPLLRIRLSGLSVSVKTQNDPFYGNSGHRNY